MADRIFWLFSERDIRCAAACSLRVRGTLARALAAASASRRDWVGRPLPLCRAISDSGTGSVLLRRNNVGLLQVVWNAVHPTGVAPQAPPRRAALRGAVHRLALTP